MTTQAEPQQPPVPVYPTAPPWASGPVAAPAETPPPEPVAYGGVAPYGSPLPEYGQLLVPYPEEMRNASRPTPPAWWPVAPLTFLLIIPGLISTMRRAAQARRGRNDQITYWLTFAVSLMVSLIAWGMIVVVALPVYWNIRATAVTKTVQEHIVKDGQLKSTSRVTATSASCNPTGPRGDDKLRSYSCLLKLDDGQTATIDVTADDDGKWTAVPLVKTTKKTTRK